MVIVTYLTALDLRYYAQTIGCAIGDLGYKTANDFYYGKKCAAANLRRLKLANGYLRIIERYESIADDHTSTVNCLTEEQMQGIILPAVQIVIGTPLPLPGLITTIDPVPTTLGNTRITDDLEIRYTDSGEPRIYT